MSDKNLPLKNLIEVRNLKIVPRANPRYAILKGVDFEVKAGESLALLGESGAGKSLALQAVCGLLPPCLAVFGSVKLHGSEVLPLGYSRSDRGKSILYLSQQPTTAFDPLTKVGPQLIETIITHFPSLTKEAARKTICETLSSLRIADPNFVLTHYPHELSGGMLQRAMIACALILKPEIVVADEPTSALDALSVQEVLQGLNRIRKETAATLIVITHHLSVAQALADRIIVMKDGQIVESGLANIANQPQTPYFRHLVEMREELSSTFKKLQLSTGLIGESGENNFQNVSNNRLIEVHRLCKAYPAHRRLFSSQTKFHSVLNGVDLQINRAEIVGLAGASGVGKTTLARLLLGLEKAEKGSISIEGENLFSWRKKHRASMSVIFQNYTQSVDPSWTVREILSEPVELKCQNLSGDERKYFEEKLKEKSLRDALQSVGLDEDKLNRFPHELSGGELQRVCIARALIAEPKLVIFDEALSSLDASIQGEIVKLLKKLPKRDSAWLFISHDLKALTALCDRILFLHDGQIVESIAKQDLFKAKHPIVRQMIEAAQWL